MEKSEKKNRMTKMSMPMLLCRCSAELSPIGWGDHQRRYHASKPGYACADCEFTSQSLADTVGHAGLEGHRLGGVKVSTYRKLLIGIPFGAEIALGGNPSAHMAGKAKQTSGPVKLELKMEAVEDPLGSEEEEINDPPPAESLCPIAAPNATFVLKSDGSQNAPSKALLLSSACHKCGKVISLSRRDPRGKAMKHVLSCLDIRQFACSRCQQPSVRADHLRRHIAVVCPGASLVEVEKEWCRARGRLGLRICFPELSTAKVAFRVGNERKHPLSKQDPEGSERVKEEKNELPADNAHLEPKEHELSEEEEPEEEISPVKKIPVKLALAQELLPRNRELRGEEKTPKVPETNYVIESLEAITCSICGSAVKWRSMSKYSAASQHAHFCLGIRPFACSNCGHGSSQVGNLRKHIGSRCPGARVEMVEKEKCQSELREGLQRCFPEENFAIRDK